VRRGKGDKRRELPLNAEARRAARRLGMGWVDVTETSRRAGNLPGMLADDGLHPSEDHYRLWLAEIRPAAEAVLRR